MTKAKNRAELKLSLLLIFTYIFSFSLYCISNFLFPNEFLAYTLYFIKNAISSMFPIIALVLILPAYSERKVKGALISAIKFSLIPILYSFPAYAFEYAYAGYTIDFVLLLSLGSTILSSITVYAELLLLLLLFVFVFKNCEKKKGASDLNIKNALAEENSAFNFSSSATLGFLSSAGAIFIYNIAREIYDTVIFLINYEGTYSTNEIVYIMYRYIYILLIFVISHYSACYAKNSVFKK